MSEEVQGNSIPEDQQKAEQGVFDSSNSFFDDLDNSVNGMVSEGEATQNTTEVTRGESGPDTVTHDESQAAPNNVDWEKRYKDSSKEAVKMAGQLKQLKPFVPVLDAMKRDSGLVDHVRNYFKNG